MTMDVLTWSIVLAAAALLPFGLIIGRLEWRVRRRARLEAELLAKQAEVRAAAARLAAQLGAQAHEARRAMIRESFLAGQAAEAGKGARRR